MAEHRLGLVTISQHYLLERLGLPADTIIRGVRMGFGSADGDIELKLEQPGLPPVQPGQRIPRTSALYEATAKGGVQFKGWCTSPPRVAVGAEAQRLSILQACVGVSPSAGPKEG